MHAYVNIVGRRRCAIELAEKFQPLMAVEAFTNELGQSGGGAPSMSIEEWKATQTEEGDELVGTPFGAMLLYEIGHVYEAKAKVWLGKHAESWASAQYFEGGPRTRLLPASVGHAVLGMIRIFVVGAPC